MDPQQQQHANDPSRHFYYFKAPSTSVSDPPVKSQMALIWRSNSLITAFCVQPKLQQASSNACSCSSRSNLVEILSETDLFRNPNREGTNLLRPEFVKRFCRMWFDEWPLRRVQSAAPNFFWKTNNCREFVTTQDNRVRRPRSLARSLATPKTKTHPQNTSPQNTKNRITKGISDFGNKAAFARRERSARWRQVAKSALDPLTRQFPRG